MTKKRTVILSMDKTNRIRWGLVFYVQMQTTIHQKCITDSIREFCEFHNIEIDEEAAKRDYYRRLELHKEALTHGI